MLKWTDLTILVTGGTGSFGKKFTETVLKKHPPKKLIIFSRDELKQSSMREDFPDGPESPLRYFIGDVRDRDRLERAFQGVDIVVHAAALKQVPTAEYNPLEVIRTNVMGASNIIDAAIDCGVSRVVALSTDKAVAAINLYGATKLCADKLFVSAGVYSGTKPTRFSVVRYGNVIGSRGSVIPIFLEKRKTGKIPITDPRMTRFWITLEQGVEFVLQALQLMTGGETFVPKIPSMRITDLANVVAPGCEHEFVGIRSGEKLHEVLLTEDEARRTLELDRFYVIRPGNMLPEWQGSHLNGAQAVPESFSYSSDNNDLWLTPNELKEMLELDEQRVHSVRSSVD